MKKTRMTTEQNEEDILDLTIHEFISFYGAI